jgi:hypothetical protein
MGTSATIPVTVTPEAAERLAELGMHAEVDRMIDYARQTLPGIVRIEVLLNARYDEDSPDGVSIDAYSQHPFDLDEWMKFKSALRRWMIATFPSEVLEHLLVCYYSEANHAG